MFGRLSRLLHGGCLLCTIGLLTCFAFRVEATEPETERAPSSDVSTMEPSDDPTRAPRDEAEWTTAESTRRVQLRDGTTITLGPNTAVNRLGTVPITVGLKDASSKAFVLELLRGTLSVEVDPNKRPIQTVLIRAPRKVGALVRTGHATVETNAQATSVAARSGLDMSVAVGEYWRALRVGRCFAVTSATPSGTQRQLLTAPSLSVDRSVVLSLGAQPQSQRLSWEGVPGAVGYRLRIRRAQKDGSELVQEQLVHQPEAAIAGLEPGSYMASVASVDDTGIESDSSLPIPLRVLAARLPEGAYLSRNTVHLPERARLRLLHTEGLEMTYGSENGLFIPVPETVGLHDGQPVRIRLREKGSREVTTLALEPLNIRPRILFDPVSAVWPGQPVGIRISLNGNDGTPYPDEQSITATVTVNTRPASAKWQRTPGLMSTRVEKPPYPGPWVLRVVVYDSSGHELARDFLEVAEQQQARPGAHSVFVATY